MQTAENRTRYLGSFAVAPLAGAWIEIHVFCATILRYSASLPSRERGLKSYYMPPAIVNMVAPLAGAWIEIKRPTLLNFSLLVAPLAGAWIEIGIQFRFFITASVAPLPGAWIEIFMRLENR